MAGPAADLSKSSQAEPLIRTPFIESNPEVSPDGRYLAYQSNESGRDEVYVRPFPKVNEGRWQVSTAGGTSPLWAKDGRELFLPESGEHTDGGTGGPNRCGEVLCGKSDQSVEYRLCRSGL